MASASPKRTSPRRLKLSSMIGFASSSAVVERYLRTGFSKTPSTSVCSDGSARAPAASRGAASHLASAPTPASVNAQRARCSSSRRTKNCEFSRMVRPKEAAPPSPKGLSLSESVVSSGKTPFATADHSADTPPPIAFASRCRLLSVGRAPTTCRPPRKPSRSGRTCEQRGA